MSCGAQGEGKEKEILRGVEETVEKGRHAVGSFCMREDCIDRGD